MPIASDDLRLFGLDLRTLWHDVKSPWAKLVSAPSWSWLAPRVAIRVAGSEGGADRLWVPDAQTRGFRLLDGDAQSQSGKKSSTFEAVVVPEHLLLRKRQFLPLLDAAQMQRAIALEASNSSPFPSGDLVWGYALNPRAASNTPGLVAVDMVVASRRRIEQYFGLNVELSDPTKAPELWAMLPDRNDLAMSLPGFGEAKRVQKARQYWMLVGGLVAIVVALCVAIAVTPYFQLRARVLQANTAYSMLDQRAAPQMAKRAALMKAEEEVKSLANIIGHRLDPLQVVQELTNALPDDTVLQRLQIEGRKVMIAGEASDAPSLMQKLGTLPQIREVRPLSASVRRPGMLKESFQIEFVLTDDFGVSASDAAVAAALAPASAASEPAAAASGAVADAAKTPASGAAPAASGVPAAPAAPAAPVASGAAPVAAVPAPAPTPAPAAKPATGGSK